MNLSLAGLRPVEDDLGISVLCVVGGSFDLQKTPFINGELSCSQKSGILAILDLAALVYEAMLVKISILTKKKPIRKNLCWED